AAAGPVDSDKSREIGIESHLRDRPCDAGARPAVAVPATEKAKFLAEVRTDFPLPLCVSICRGDCSSVSHLPVRPKAATGLTRSIHRVQIRILQIKSIENPWLRTRWGSLLFGYLLAGPKGAAQSPRGSRPDRHNNPTAMTTGVAQAGG